MLWCSSGWVGLGDWRGDWIRVRLGWWWLGLLGCPRISVIGTGWWLMEDIWRMSCYWSEGVGLRRLGFGFVGRMADLVRR